MMGISWGGFNSLQIAYLSPKPLKAIISICSTDDRYEDDIHYKGGKFAIKKKNKLNASRNNIYIYKNKDVY
jgi:predicted acyl esterase